MEFFNYFKITSVAIIEILLISALGFFMYKKKIIAKDGLQMLSNFLVEIALPFLIFHQLISGFRFSIYKNWWVFPLLSLGITIFGFGIGYAMLKPLKDIKQPREFLSLIGFQNSGYLPLILVTMIMPPGQKENMLIYIFLFLLGFNLVIWSYGVWFLSHSKAENVEFAKLFSPPVIAILAALFLIGLGLDKFIPELILKPVKLIGDCTLPLAMILIGASMAGVDINQVDKKAIGNIVLGKLFVMPILALAVVLVLKPPQLVGLLIILQAAMPSATSLAVITHRYNLDAKLISHGVFFTHVAAIFTVPLFVSLYWMFAFLL